MTPPIRAAKLNACAWHREGENPLGYLEWHAKADAAYKKGQRQTRCKGCLRWFFPWETK